MNYSDRYELQMIDEWRQCYINYSQLKLYTKIIQDCNREEIYLTRQLEVEERREVPQEKQNILHFILKNQISSVKKDLIQKRRKQFSQIATHTHQMFIQCFKNNLLLYESFVNFKFDQIFHRYTVTRRLYLLMSPGQIQEMSTHLRHYIEYLYVQSHFLSSMVRSNIEAQNRILEKHKLNSYKYFETPEFECQNFITIQKCNTLKRDIQCFYVEANKKTMNKSRDRIQKIGKKVQYNKNVQSLLVGFLSGCLLTIVVFMCVILARENIVLQIDPIFNQYFPLWRGISFFIFYAWMLGTNLFYFQRYKISHKIILENQFIRYPKSNDLFKISSLFSIVFIVLFVIYALQLADIIQTWQMSPQWLPLYIWSLFLIFMINPLPIFYIQGRLYIFKMLFKIIKSILFPVDFLTVIATTQLFALINALQDTVYTVCFYTSLKLPLPLQQTKQDDICKTPASLSKFIFTLFLYSLRIWHCVREVYRNWGKEPFYKSLDFLNTIKFTCGLITTILSYLWRDANNSQILPAWIIFATITTIYSFIWDCKVSFDVLNLKAKHFLLRDEIIYPKGNYYFWIVCTFLLRCTWVLYISPNISKSFLGSPEIFLLTFGYLQIIRRGIWNVIRLELEQVRNRQAFRAVPKEKESIQQKIEKLIQKKLQKQIKGILSAESLQCNEQEESQIEKHKNKLKKLKEQKQRIAKEAKQVFNKQLNQRLVAEEYDRKTQKYIQQLIQKIYD